MRASPQLAKWSPVDRGPVPSVRSVVASRTIAASFGDVKRTVRVFLAQLVKVASSSTEHDGYDLVINVSMRRWARWIRVPVEVEVESAYQPRSGLIAHLRWRGRRHPKLFPVMEADLLARPTAGTGTELVLDGTYRPPLGILGLAGDLVVGRHVARSTAESFIDGLGRALEDAIAEGRCTPPVKVDAASGVA